MSKYAYAAMYVGIASGRTKAHLNILCPGNVYAVTIHADEMPNRLENIIVPKTKIIESVSYTHLTLPTKA